MPAGNSNSLKKRCFQLAVATIRLCDQLPQKRSAWVISDQLIRSVCSIGANLVEARGSSSRLEFKRYNEIALKSSNESIYWFEFLEETGLIGKEKIRPLLQEAIELNRMIASGVLKLKSSRL